MPTHGKRQSDELLIAALASGQTLAQAAQAGRVSVSTVERRLRLPAFRARVAVARSAALERAISILAERSADAALTLAALLASDEDGMRLQAASRLLKLAIEGHQQHNVDERLRALEAGEAPP
jgi:hypothetical protein